MRMVVIQPESIDAKALVARLIGKGGDSDSALKTLQRINPHLDFTRLTAGTVLLVPDAPDFETSESVSIAGQGLAALDARFREAAEGARLRVRGSYEALAIQRKDVNGALKTAAVKRLVESDPDLKKQLEEADAVSKSDEQQFKSSEAELEALQSALADELGMLSKMLT